MAAFRLVVEQFPGTFYAALAEEQIAKLEQAARPAHAELSAGATEESLGLKRAERRQIQAALQAEGFRPGSLDGLFGPLTREAITRWQSAQGSAVTGYLDAEAARTLLAVAPRVEAVAPGPTGPNWVTAQNQPCKLWTPSPEHVAAVIWSGGCADGMASGYGKVVWQGRGSTGEQIYEGDVRGGNYHGLGTYTFTLHNDRYEGAWRDGKPHGFGVLTSTSGVEFRGTWKRGCFGRKDGRWAHFYTSAEACGFK